MERNGRQVGLQHLPGRLSGASPASTAPKAASSGIRALHRATEEEAIREALERNGYNRLAAARELGMHKSTLFRKLKKLQIELPEIDGRHSNSTPPRVA